MTDDVPLSHLRPLPRGGDRTLPGEDQSAEPQGGGGAGASEGAAQGMGSGISEASLLDRAGVPGQGDRAVSPLRSEETGWQYGSLHALDCAGPGDCTCTPIPVMTRYGE